MGVHPSTSFLAWFAENVAVLAGGCAALAAVLRASGIFAHSDAVLVFLFLLDFAVSVVMLSYLLGACFGRADMAALCASLLYVVSFLPYIVLLVLHGRLGAAAQTLLVSAPPAAGPLGAHGPRARGGAAVVGSGRGAVNAVQPSLPSTSRRSAGRVSLCSTLDS